jgi:alpha-tubulin suppressor-like RCC1 family protein
LGIEHGELPDDRRTMATPLLGVTGARSLHAGDSFTCATTQDGRVFCWGVGSDGQLGNGSTEGSTSPVAVTGLDDVTAMSAGASHACAVRSNGSTLCWGQNFWGQVGDGVPGERGMRRTTPVTVMGPALVAVTAGFGSSCGLTAEGRGLCWGNNESGSLGNGNTTTRPLPDWVVDLTDAVSLSEGLGGHLCAVRADDSVWCWGPNPDGRLGDGTTEPRLTPTQITGW